MGNDLASRTETVLRATLHARAAHLPTDPPPGAAAAVAARLATPERSGPRRPWLGAAAAAAAIVLLTIWATSIGPGPRGAPLHQPAGSGTVASSVQSAAETARRAAEEARRTEEARLAETARRTEEERRGVLYLSTLAPEARSVHLALRSDLRFVATMIDPDRDATVGCGIVELGRSADATVRYLWATCVGFTLQDGTLREVYGSGLPVRVTVTGQGDHLTVRSIDVPQQRTYEADVMTWFPADVRSRFQDPAVLAEVDRLLQAEARARLGVPPATLVR